MKFSTQTFTVLLATAGLVGGRAVAQAPVTPTAATQDFFRAIQDSNLTRMAEVFGNSKGPSSRTHAPKDYPRRMIYMQAVLGGTSARTLNEVRKGKDSERLVTVELSRGPCKVTLSVNTVLSKQGWLVHDFDLDQASQVNSPCQGSPKAGGLTGNRGG